MGKSVFMNKAIMPDESELKEVYSNRWILWKEIRDCVFEKYPKAEESWFYAGDKFGWAFRIKDKKRAIVYFLPVEPNFKLSFVFGEKAVGCILNSTVSPEIKQEIQHAKVYAEGRSLQIEINENTGLADIKKLIDIKMSN